MTDFANVNVIATCNQRIAALESEVSPKASVAIDGAIYKPADVISVYKTALTTRAAVATARAQLKVAVAKRDAAEEARAAIDRGLRSWVASQFGEGSQAMLNFGFATAKRATRSVLDKAHSVLLAQATRAARGTKGKRQKGKIHGVVAAPSPSVAMPAISTSAAAAPSGAVATR